MRAKKANKPARSVRYLLSADRTLGKISLRKISERVKKATEPLRSKPSRQPRGARTSPRSAWPLSPRAMLLAVGCIVAAAAIITARQPSPDPLTAKVEPAEAHDSTERASVAAHRPARDIVLPAERSKKTGAMKTTRASLATAPATAAPPSRVPEPASTPAATPIGTARSSEPPPVPAAESPSNVTIIGCLQRDDDTFRLTDTEGTEAPKSRSWKSGFLRKRSAAVEILDPAGSLRLSDNVGRRVSVTGTLVDREMRPRSVRRLSATCD